MYSFWFHIILKTRLTNSNTQLSLIPSLLQIFLKCQTYTLKKDNIPSHALMMKSLGRLVTVALLLLSATPASPPSPLPFPLHLIGFMLSSSILCSCLERRLYSAQYIPSVFSKRGNRMLWKTKGSIGIYELHLPTYNVNSDLFLHILTPFSP